MKAAAYVHGPPRIHRMAQAFAQGCARHGIPCQVLPVGAKATPADLVWVYGLGPALPAFEAHAGAIRLVGDKGYFAEHKMKPNYLRVSINAQQPDAHLQLRPHPLDRWHGLGITAQPVASRGKYILLCGIGPKQAARHGLAYGEWERKTYARLSTFTGLPIMVREKPKNPPIKGLPRSPHRAASEAIRGAWAVVCMTGNIGVDAILEGVPVVAESGPGRVYYPGGLEQISTLQPLAPAAREAALADIAYWQWTLPEIAAGDLIANLKTEGII